MAHSFWQVLNELAPNSPEGFAREWTATTEVIVAACESAGVSITPTALPIIFEFVDSLGFGFPWSVHEASGTWRFTWK